MYIYALTHTYDFTPHAHLILSEAEANDLFISIKMLSVYMTENFGEAIFDLSNEELGEVLEAVGMAYSNHEFDARFGSGFREEFNKVMCNTSDLEYKIIEKDSLFQIYQFETAHGPFYVNEVNAYEVWERIEKGVKEAKAELSIEKIEKLRVIADSWILNRPELKAID